MSKGSGFVQQYTPMIQQYLEIKAQHSDAILFFRLGDFYEMFFEDAEVASRLLAITLTSRDGGQGQKVAMCGVPFHAAEAYLARLLRAGQKVAICEQVEDSSSAKGLVRREVVRIVTPATYSDAPADTNNYVSCWQEQDGESVLATIDYTTGSVSVTSFDGETSYGLVVDEVHRLSPREVILPQLAIPDVLEESVTRLSALRRTTRGLTVEESSSMINAIWGDVELTPLASITLGEIIAYLKDLRLGDFSHLTRPLVSLGGRGALLDMTTRRNLEVTRALGSGEREGSLLWVLDFTATAMGARLIKQWLEQPLISTDQVNARLQAVDALWRDNLWRNQVREALRRVYDLPRLLAKVVAGTAHPRDLVTLQKSLAGVTELNSLLSGFVDGLLGEIMAELMPHSDLQQLLTNALLENPPVNHRDGGVIKEGFHAEVDALRSVCRDTKSLLASFEAEERQATGIKSLKIGFNRVFGYYIEVTHTNLSLVPPRYHRKQTLANAERFVTAELKELENTIMTAEERLLALEEELFVSLRQRVAADARSIMSVARRVGELDVLQAFAEAASRYRFVKPEVNASKTIAITGGRHPVVERTVGSHHFVPNDTHLGPGELAVITGPNMAGKSTYMRQVALIVLMAQVGSFVPAEKATIGYVDRIFTRVGAADDLYGGQSTFMVEMLETSLALAEATERSLLLFDEVGRGTSTYDGMALAQAIMEFVHDQVSARTLFSTHYHELTRLSDHLARCQNYVVAILESGKEVIFLHRVQPGKASKSYGVHVARMAGLPRSVISRAIALLKEHESKKSQPFQQTNFLQAVAEAPLYMEPDPRTALALAIYEELTQLTPEALTPLQALRLLFELKQKTEKVGETRDD